MKNGFEIIKKILDAERSEFPDFKLTNIIDIPDNIDSLGELDDVSDLLSGVKSRYVNQSVAWPCEDCYYGTVAYIVDDSCLIFSFSC